MFKFKSLAVIAACAAAMVLVSCEKEKEFPITPGETQLTTTAEGGEISLSVICEQSDWKRTHHNGAQERKTRTSWF